MSEQAESPLTTITATNREYWCIYQQGNLQVGPIFRDWLSDWEDLGATTLSLGNTGGTDHLSFDRVGIPGFQFIQDPIEYDTRTHHSNMDNWEHLSPYDLNRPPPSLPPSFGKPPCGKRQCPERR